MLFYGLDNLWIIKKYIFILIDTFFYRWITKKVKSVNIFFKLFCEYIS